MGPWGYRFPSRASPQAADLVYFSQTFGQAENPRVGGSMIRPIDGLTLCCAQGQLRCSDFAPANCSTSFATILSWAPALDKFVFRQVLDNNVP